MTVSPKAEAWFEARAIDPEIVARIKASSQQPKLTGAEVLSCLDYEASTGVFRWKKNAFKAKKWNTRYSGAVAGSPNQWGHIRIRVLGRDWMAHHLVWLIETGGLPIGMLDHINGDPSDNRFSNLRLATNAQNQWNRRASVRNKVGLKGVSWDSRRERWTAHVCANGEQKRIGYFSSKEAAFTAYCDAAKKLHGEFFNSGEPR